jgi:hypothetical protein
MVDATNDLIQKVDAICDMEDLIQNANATCDTKGTQDIDDVFLSNHEMESYNGMMKESLVQYESQEEHNQINGRNT